MLIRKEKKTLKSVHLQGKSKSCKAAKILKGYLITQKTLEVFQSAKKVVMQLKSLEDLFGFQEDLDPNILVAGIFSFLFFS